MSESMTRQVKIMPVVDVLRNVEVFDIAYVVVNGSKKFLNWNGWTREAIKQAYVAWNNTLHDVYESEAGYKYIIINNEKFYFEDKNNLIKEKKLDNKKTTYFSYFVDIIKKTKGSFTLSYPDGKKDHYNVTIKRNTKFVYNNNGILIAIYLSGYLYLINASEISFKISKENISNVVDIKEYYQNINRYIKEKVTNQFLQNVHLALPQILEAAKWYLNNYEIQNLTYNELYACMENAILFNDVYLRKLDKLTKEFSNYIVIP